MTKRLLKPPKRLRSEIPKSALELIADAEALDRLDRAAAAPKPPRPLQSSEFNHAEAIEAVLATDDPKNRGALLISQLAACLNAPIPALDVAASFMKALGPSTHLEVLLLSQMAATHTLAMHFLSKTAFAKDFEAIEAYVSHANRLLRTFAHQVEALQALRQKGQPQKVEVKHVHVSAGGQAIVGDVTTGGRGKNER